MDPIRWPRACATLLVAAALVAGCARAGRPEDRPSVAWAALVLRCQVGDAAVWVDERYLGELRDLPDGIRLPAGGHRVELRHDRYHVRYLELSLAAGETRVVDVALAEVLP